MKIQVILLLLCGFPLSGFSQARCTEIGCRSGVYINIEFSGGMPDGAYEVTMFINGNNHACHFRVEDGRNTGCSDSLGAQNLEVYADNNERVAEIRISHTASLPTSVKLEITFNGRKLFQTSEDVASEPVFPNGKLCGEVCRQWHYRKVLFPQEPAR